MEALWTLFGKIPSLDTVMLKYLKEPWPAM